MSALIYVMVEGMGVRAAQARAAASRRRDAGLARSDAAQTHHDTGGPACLDPVPPRSGAGGPAAVVTGGKIRDRNPQAAAAGVALGVPLLRARQICPQLQVHHLAGDDPLWELWAERLRRNFYRWTPWIEPDGPQALFLRVPVSRMYPVSRRLRDLEEWTVNLCPALADRLTAGIGPNRFQARLLAWLAGAEPESPDRPGHTGLQTGLYPGPKPPVPVQHAAGGRLTWATASGNAWLADLDVAALWPLRPATRLHLSRLGLRTLGDVRRAGAEALAAHLGEEGRRAYHLACGNDESTLRPGGPPRQLWETRRFEGGASDGEALEAAATAAAGALASRLLRQGEAAGELVLALEGSGMLAARRRFSEPTARPAALREASRSLLREALATSSAGGNAGALSIDRITLWARRLTVLPARQQSLWNRPAGEGRRKQLETLVDHLRARYDSHLLRWGAPAFLSRRERMLAYWDPLRARAGESRAGESGESGPGESSRAHERDLEP